MKPTPDQIRQWATQCGDDWSHTLREDKEFLERFADLTVAWGAEQSLVALYTTPPDTQAVLQRALDALRDFDYDKRLAAIAELEGFLK